jgi:hypothetical protein
MEFKESLKLRFPTFISSDKRLSSSNQHGSNCLEVEYVVELSALVVGC